MTEFDVNEFIESPKVDKLKKLNKDQLLELAENLSGCVHIRKSQNKSVICYKILQYFVSEGTFEATDNAGEGKVEIETAIR